MSVPRQTSGFTVAEVVIAIVILILGIAGSIELVAHAMRANVESADRLLAANLAEEGLEALRNVRDSNYLQNYPWNGGGSADFGSAGGWGADFSKSTDTTATALCLTVEPKIGAVVPWTLAKIDCKSDTDMFKNARLKFNSTSGLYTNSDNSNGTDSKFARYLKVTYLEVNDNSNVDTEVTISTSKKVRVESVVLFGSQKIEKVVLVSYLTDWRKAPL
jgi:Tfp pilus assembly protein PilV